MLDKEILILCEKLGAVIKEDARIKRMNAADEAFKNDAELQTKITEYNVQTLALTQQYKESEKDMEVINAIEARIKTLYEEIGALPSMAEYNKAQEEVNAFMNEVNAEITFCITGERPSNCTHDCSTCSGCH